MRFLFESRAWWTLRPDQSLLSQAPNTGGTEVLAARSPDGSLAMAYTPYGTPFTLALNQLAPGPLHAWWFNPRDGTYVDAGVVAGSALTFDPPGDERRGNDWLLVLEADMEAPPPGRTRQ
jgi:hypothetical protein